jgi:hypothetical protein
MSEVGKFRGAGGAVIDLPLPLAENFAQQVTRGELVRVDLEDRPAPPKEPNKAALKDDWVGWARHVDPSKSVDDLDAMTRLELIEKYGNK